MIIGVTVLPFFVFDKLGGGARMSGIIMAIQAIAYAAVSLVSTRFVARAENGLVWSFIGIAMLGILFSVAVLVHEPVLYTLISTVGYAGLALAWPALWSWLGAEPDVRVRTRRISHYNLSWSIGLAVGPLFAGPLYRMDYRLPFLLVGLLSFAALGLVAALPHEKQHYRASDEPDVANANETNRAASEVYLYATWLACALSIAFLGASRSVFPKRVDELAGAGMMVLFARGKGGGNGFLTEPAMVFSYLSFVLNMARVLVFTWMGASRRWQHRFSWLVAPQIVAGAALWWLSRTESFTAMSVCFAAIGVNTGMVFFASAFYSLADPARKHQRAAINESTIGFGNFAGSIGFGLLAGAFGSTMPFRWAPAILATGLVFQFGLLRWSAASTPGARYEGRHR